MGNTSGGMGNTSGWYGKHFRMVWETLQVLVRSGFLMKLRAVEVDRDDKVP